MTEIIDAIHHEYPFFPGGPLVVLGILISMLVLLVLYRRTCWPGWLVALIAVVGYSAPFFIEFHR